MGHTPYGYKIENGKAVVDQEKSEKIKLLFEAYLPGDSLATAAKKAGIKAFHAGTETSLKTKDMSVITSTLQSLIKLTLKLRN